MGNSCRKTRGGWLLLGEERRGVLVVVILCGCNCFHARSGIVVLDECCCKWLEEVEKATV
ncbi:hypothetical protein BDW59DRAFT_147299 [Aspergillus cavernicola]|uniref:Uncharacterized protein n=1 Tax=Aspergillus cavernicola TaxID=176166 RepID=A0ABR4IAB6_9EURO